MKNEGFRVLKIEKNNHFFDYQRLLLKNKGSEVLKTEKKNFLVLKNRGKTLWITGFFFIKDGSFNIPIEVIWNIHRKKGTDLLTSARGEFGP